MRLTTDRGRWWLSHLLPLLIVIPACSGGEGESVTTLANTSQVESTTTVPAATATPGGDDVFDAGLAATSPNYRFESTVVVGDQVITSISGVVDDEAIAADISAGDTVVSYIRTGDGGWLTNIQGEWIEVDDEPPAVPPLTLLADANSFEEVTADQETTTLEGTLGPAAGAAEGIRFTVTITDGLITQIQYQAETDVGMAVVTTRLTEIGTAGEVAPPGT